MEQEKENRALSGISPDFAKVLKTYQVSQVYIAKHLFSKEWDEEDEKLKRRLTGRLRNKIDGSGKLSEVELFQLQNIVIELGEALIQAAKKSIAETAHLREKTEHSVFKNWK